MHFACRFAKKKAPKIFACIKTFCLLCNDGQRKMDRFVAILRNTKPKMGTHFLQHKKACKL